MNNQKTKTIKASVSCITIILFVLSSLFMFDFYKCLSGFIANGFREPLVMLPIVLSYLLPVLCFLFYFYDFYIKRTSRLAKIIYLSVVIIWATVNLVLIFNSLDIYVSNNRMGVYDTVYSIFFKFPYDGIIINIFLILMQIINLIMVIAPNSTLTRGKEQLKQYGIFKLSILEYIPLCVLAILVFVFVGDAFCSLNAIENALYDPKYIYLVLWVLVIPLGNLLYLVIKPEIRSLKKSSKITALSLGIGVNIVFALLLLIFELISPDFIAHVGKPLFLIAFSVSMPIEMIVLLGIGLVSVAIYIAKLILLLAKKK